MRHFHLVQLRLGRDRGVNGNEAIGNVGRIADLNVASADLGYPRLVLDPAGDCIEVHIFESVDLPDHWARLDEFEGSGYRRVTARVTTADGELDASIYEIDEKS